MDIYGVQVLDFAAEISIFFIGQDVHLPCNYIIKQLTQVDFLGMGENCGGGQIPEVVIRQYLFIVFQLFLGKGCVL